jgi:hypothetical protein
MRRGPLSNKFTWDAPIRSVEDLVTLAAAAATLGLVKTNPRGHVFMRMNAKWTV